jgi:predicted alpha-1,2-mannosidase
MPTTGPLRLEPGTPEEPDSGYRSRFRHETESAEPGFYRVELDDHGVTAELTATARVGLHRYTFVREGPTHLVLDLTSSIYDHDEKILWSSVQIVGPDLIVGSRRTQGWAPDRELHFAIRFSRPFEGHGLVNREPAPEYRGFPPPAPTEPRRPAIEGRRVVGHFDFDAGPSSPLEVAVAISNVDVTGALANLETLPAPWDFDAVRKEARDRWSRALATIDVRADSTTETTFYTALYHTMIAPNLASDADGRYRGPDHRVHRAEGFDFHSTFSLWDTFRALHPLLTLIQRDQTSHFLRSLMAHAEHSPHGLLPVWSFHGLETWCMIGYHAVPVLAEAILAGVEGVDGNEALDTMVAAATHGAYDGLAGYMELGYVPIDREVEAASKTLEYAFDDWTIARLARTLGRDGVAERFEKRALSYRNVFDAGTGFMRARRSDGAFRGPFDPSHAAYGGDYTEGSAWQYSWFVPHDPAGLIELMGGEEKFMSRLDRLFEEKPPAGTYDEVEDITGLVGQYAHGNEPGHHTPYLYVYAGAPWKTQERVTFLLDKLYDATPSGIPGNDDCGQMSAWYVFGALGFYPVAPGSGEFVLTRPKVRSAVLHLENGEAFEISVAGSGAYVVGATLDGKPLLRTFIRTGEILAGGSLVFQLGDSPSPTWGVAREHRPSSMTPWPGS